MQTARIGHEYGSGRPNDFVNFVRRIKHENLVVREASIASKRGRSRAMAARDEHVSPSISSNIRQVDEEFQEPYAIHIEVE